MKFVSWPFFGSNRGELAHPDEINRGPWRSTHDYLLACTEREIRGVILENEGKAAPHRLHLDPDEILSSQHHKVSALSGDVSDQSDEWDWEESQAEWDGPGHKMYQDYRRMQRTTFLVAHLQQREQKVKEEYCYVCPDIVKEFARYDKEPDRLLKHTVTSPNGRSISIDVGYERFLAPEIFFNPEIYSSDFLTPLPNVVDGVIQSSPIDVRRGLYKNIVL